MAQNHIKKDPSYTGRLLLAINALKNKEITAVRKAARIYVSETTLRNRLKGRSERSITDKKRQKLSPTEEESLRTWILSMESRGCSVRPQMLQVMANILLLKRGTTAVPLTVGINWVSSFLKRQTDLKTQYTHRLTYSRAKCEDPKLIREHFDTLQRVRSEYGIVDEDIYNFDETGFALGIIATAKVKIGRAHV